jgi:hypothetical protein
MIASWDHSGPPGEEPAMCRRSASYFLSLIGVLLWGTSAPGDDSTPVADQNVRSVVDRRVREWQPTAEERSFDEIGWSTSLLQAERLAKEHGRPIFLFTHDGKMQVGRC